MRKFSSAAAAAVTGLAVAVGAAVALAGSGPSPGQLSDSGWTCFLPPAPGEVVHCSPPGVGAPQPNGRPTYTLLVFDTTDPGSFDAGLLGTELLVRADLYDGRPCPQDPHDDPSTAEVERGYLPLPFGYFACHHFGQ